MSKVLPFNNLMAELTKFQEAVGEIHRGLRNEKHKAILGEVLDRLREEKAEAEATVPATLNKLVQRSEQTQAELKSELDRLQKQFAQANSHLAAARKKQTEPAQAPQAAPAEPKIDPHLGEQLRTELLERFAAPDGSAAQRTAAIKEAWEDW